MIRAALFDFDGTLSLIREGWAGIMADLGLDLFRERAIEVRPDDRTFLEDQMLRLSGKPSIYQMRRLADEISHRGGTPSDPDSYLTEFHRRLFEKVDCRIADLEAGRVLPAAWTVSGSHALLEVLQSRGVPLYLASGTDQAHVHRELALLDLAKYFGPRVYAPANNTPQFSKRDVVEMIVRTHGGPPVGFGDGYAETVEVKQAGGFVVGVASREAGEPGLNELKKRMLLELGADVVVADYARFGPLVAKLWDEG
ncbi:MAG TPA: HAD family hydrolase [Fimbriiglobus sp.]|jgi:beta-phosphoglucomutase-like phosphatase (HAD superfamily)